MKDMTSGKPAGLLLRFFVPVLMGNLFQQLYTIVDTMIVGRTLGSDALAGVGSTGSINYMITGFVIGGLSGFGVVYGQKFGAKDNHELRRTIAGSIYLSGIVTVIFTFATMLFCNYILDWMNTPQEIWQEAYDYIIVIFAGIAATALYNLTANLLRAVGDSRTPFIVLIVASVINVILDLVFILVFHMGTVGAALATVISQAVSGVSCLIYIRKKYDFLAIRKDEWKVTKNHYTELLTQGIPMAFQFSITAIGTVTLQVAINDLGPDYVAGITAGTKILDIVIMIFAAFGVAVCNYCSQNVGAKQYDRVKLGVSIAYKMQLSICAVGFIFIVLFGKYFALLFVDATETEVLDNIVTYLRINAFALPFSATLGIFRFALEGMGHSFQAMFAGVAEMVGRVITAFSFTALWGYKGACLGNASAWLMADLLLIAFYIRICRREPYLSQKAIERGLENEIKKCIDCCK